MLKAGFHVHSAYSDGEYTLAEVKRIFAGLGCSVDGITVMTTASTNSSWRITSANALSDERFLFLCSLEYRCEQKMHILGYGSTELAHTQESQAVIRHIEEHHGLAVIAHPKDSMFSWIETFTTLPSGTETWNSKYDGRYAPRPGTFELFRRLRARRSGMGASYGQDRHWKKQLFTELYCEALNRGQILKALAAGNYCGAKGALRLPPTGELSPELSARFGALHAQSDRMRNFLRARKKTIDRLGITPRASIKSHLRKML